MFVLLATSSKNTPLSINYQLERGTLNETESNVLNETVINVQKFYSQLLKVESGFQVDITVQVTEDTTSFEASFQLPITGTIKVKHSEIPDEAPTFQSENRRLFEILFRETAHILGIHGKWMKEWIDSDGNKYESTLTSGEMIVQNYYSKSVKMITTPHAVEFVQKRFGLVGNNIYINTTSKDLFGIEVYPTSQDWVWLSGRVYYNEIMAPEVVSPLHMILSEATLALFRDVGWYEVSSDLSEKFPYGDGHLFTENPYTKFHKSPVYDFENQFSKLFNCGSFNGQDYCNWDRSGYGKCDVEVLNCTQDPTKCSNDNDNWKKDGWYRATATSGLRFKGKKQQFDYLPMVTNPKQVCAYLKPEDETYPNLEKGGSTSWCAIHTLQEGTSHLPSFVPGCFPMKCNYYHELFVQINGSWYMCPSSNSRITVPGFGGQFVCPDPSQMCRSRVFYNSLTAEENEGYFGKISPNKGLATALIIIFSLLALILYIILYYCMTKTGMLTIVVANTGSTSVTAVKTTKSVPATTTTTTTVVKRTTVTTTVIN